jgi:hypothetical protein
MIQLYDFIGVLAPLFFVCFLLCTLVAILFGRKRYVRTSYIAVFFSLLVVVNLVGAPALPLIDWHKFSDPPPQTYVEYEFHVVDADGNELDYDHRATLFVDGVTMSPLHKRMLNAYSPGKNEGIACYLLNRAREYRTTVQTRSLLHFLRFPPHGLENTWSAEGLSRYSEFVGIRLYRLEMNTSTDGSEIGSSSGKTVFEFDRPCAASANQQRQYVMAVA